MPKTSHVKQNQFKKFIQSIQGKESVVEKKKYEKLKRVIFKLFCQNVVSNHISVSIEARECLDRLNVKHSKFFIRFRPKLVFYFYFILF